jgi:hypothetical protein
VIVGVAIPKQLQAEDTLVLPWEINGEGRMSVWVGPLPGTALGRLVVDLDDTVLGA